MHHELIEMGILHSAQGDWQGMRVKLTCGCWSDWHHMASSAWDFPGEAHRCQMHGMKQINLLVQVKLMEERP